LSTSHEIEAGADDWHRVLLYWCRGSVSSELNVVEEVSIDDLFGKLCDGIWGGVLFTASVPWVGRSDADWDIAVLVKIDARVLVDGIAGFTKEFLLGSWV
jgi:hypothetical protein